MRKRVVAVAAPLGCSRKKAPPISTLPSACTAKLNTPPGPPLALGSKPMSREPSAWSRAMRLRVVAVAAPLGWRVVKVPPSSTLPSGCTAMLKTLLLALGLKSMSSVPSALSRAMRLRSTPSTVVKEPPSSTLPSGCKATLRTVPFASG